MTDEALIEEAAKKIWAATDALAWEHVSEELRDSCRLEARAALAVFEAAYTPTTDEREALWADYAMTVEGVRKATATQANLLHRTWVDGFAAGFRRSEVPVRTLNEAIQARDWDTVRRLQDEVPEPSAEEWAARINAAREKAIAKGYTPEHDAKHGVRHLLRWAIDYARRGRVEDSSGLMAAAIDLADIASAELERLRHVADTMRAVSEALRTRYASDSQAAYFMRQIDAALEAVPPPQGAPSDARGIIARALIHSAHMDSFSAWDLADELVAALRAAAEVGGER